MMIVVKNDSETLVHRKRRRIWNIGISKEGRGSFKWFPEELYMDYCGYPSA